MRARVALPFLLLLAAADAFCVAGAPPGGESTLVLAERDSCIEPSIGMAPVEGKIWKAQAVTPAAPYALAEAEIAGVNLGGATTLHIQSARGNGSPGGELAAVTVASGTRFVLSKPLSLQAGETYLLALSNDGGEFRWRYSGGPGCYDGPRGQPYTSLDGGATWSVDVVDFNFILYERTVDLPPIETTVRDTAAFAPDGAPVQPVVAVISLPFGPPLHDPQEWTEQLIDKLAEASRYHGYSDPDAPPFVRYRIYGGSVIRADAVPPKQPDGSYDFQWVYDRYGLCELIRSGVADEVWLWDAGQGGFPEWAAAGPEWTVRRTYNPPDCGRQVVTMAFNYNREIDVALESFHHRLEATLTRYAPCDFWTETWPWRGGPEECEGLVSDRYGFVARPFAGNGFVGGCGDAHHPPNIVDEEDYVYDDPASVRSICEDWSRDGSARSATIACRDWGCSHWGYHVWWMQNMPGWHNTNRDRNGRPQPNWWTYVFPLDMSS